MDAMLSGFCLLLSNYIQHRNESNMNVENVLAALFQAELTRGLKIGERFNVANGSTYFYQH